MAGNNATRKEQNNPALLKIKTDQSQLALFGSYKQSISFNKADL